jgi:hypothetical protein
MSLEEIENLEQNEIINIRERFKEEIKAKRMQRFKERSQKFWLKLLC